MIRRLDEASTPSPSCGSASQTSWTTATPSTKRSTGSQPYEISRGATAMRSGSATAISPRDSSRAVSHASRSLRAAAPSEEAPKRPSKSCLKTCAGPCDACACDTGEMSPGESSETSPASMLMLPEEQEPPTGVSCGDPGGTAGETRPCEIERMSACGLERRKKKPEPCASSREASGRSKLALGSSSIADASPPIPDASTSTVSPGEPPRLGVLFRESPPPPRTAFCRRSAAVTVRIDVEKRTPTMAASLPGLPSDSSEEPRRRDPGGGLGASVPLSEDGPAAAAASISDALFASLRSLTLRSASMT